MLENKIRKAIICPNCGKLISASVEECYNCGLKNPGKMGLHSFIQKIFSGNFGFIQGVIYFSVALYVIGLLIDPKALFQTQGGIFSLFSPSTKSLFMLGMTGKPFIIVGKWWTLITAIYLHGGLLHILFNMLWIRQLGPIVEGVYGTSRLILIFTISGVFGFVLSNVFSGSITIGASGSVFGLLGALIYYGRDRGGVFGQVVYPQLLMWAGIMFLFGFIMPAVNNLAHLGGFIGGYVSGIVLSYQEKRSETTGQKKLATLAIGASIVAFLLSLLTIPSSLKLYYYLFRGL